MKRYPIYVDQYKGRIKAVCILSPILGGFILYTMLAASHRDVTKYANRIVLLSIPIWFVLIAIFGSIPASIVSRYEGVFGLLHFLAACVQIFGAILGFMLAKLIRVEN